MRRLIQDQQLAPNERITGIVDGVTYEATLLANGTVHLLGEIFPDITTAANFVREKSTRGWYFWKVERNGSWISLAKLRRG